MEYTELIKFLSEERLDKYLKYTDNDIKLAIKLYELNIEISKSLYLPLNYFEIFLRNSSEILSASAFAVSLPADFHSELYFRTMEICFIKL